MSPSSGHWPANGSEIHNSQLVLLKERSMLSLFFLPSFFLQLEWRSGGGDWSSDLGPPTGNSVSGIAE